MLKAVLLLYVLPVWLTGGVGLWLAIITTNYTIYIRLSSPFELSPPILDNLDTRYILNMLVNNTNKHMTNKTYKHFINGKHVATYKQPNLKHEAIKDALKTVVAIIALAALAYLYMIVTS